MQTLTSRPRHRWIRRLLCAFVAVGGAAGTVLARAGLDRVGHQAAEAEAGRAAAEARAADAEAGRAAAEARAAAAEATRHDARADLARLTAWAADVEADRDGAKAVQADLRVRAESAEYERDVVWDELAAMTERAARAKALKADDLVIRQVATRLSKGADGKDWWRWELRLDGSPETLARVNRVEYRFHPTFPRPVVEETDSESKFLSVCTGYGESTVSATVFLDCESARLELKHEMTKQAD